ncbi:DNA ligase D [Legionella sp. 16cNR16C]|uniref:DNA ligase D n=1 Tax=Legionella sp. 16cNR16C TaxID=2905656 RepID=UPI001E4DCA3D|nr:DNA ligase D [Legionella sp. 16cNR16C]MCE3045061.1 DNA ligase D [Legionella sp. 16cNR16C]
MSLDRYQKKRDFHKTPEPKGRVHRKHRFLYIIQKHAASHLHYDFRLELDGVLKSWAVPKGPCLDPAVKRLAVQVEDHPVEYGSFEGIIPKGEYGGGTVMLWDKGKWKPLDDDPAKAYEKGHLHFELQAEKLNGQWDLIRFKEKQWFLIKHRDKEARPLDEYDITNEEPNSVVSHQSLDEITRNYQSVWHSKESSQNNSPVKSAKKKQKKYKLALPARPFLQNCPVELATLTNKAPISDDWLHELKFDGYRIIAYKRHSQIQLLSRNQLDWTRKFPNVVDALKNLPVDNIIVDGEITVLDENSRSSFQLLQNAMSNGAQTHFTYYLFDLLYLDQYDTRSLPLLERKKLLAALLEDAEESLRYSDHILGDGENVFKQSCDFNLEGIISKDIHSSYQGKRSRKWLKIKCSKRQEFVIGGFTKSEKNRTGFRSLLLGVYDENGQLNYCGKVGTGFTEASLKSIARQLEPLQMAKNPFNTNPPGVRSSTWVKPELIAEVEFSEWTDDGHLRHPSFKGLRLDKMAKEIRNEEEIPLKKITPVKGKNMPAIKLSNPDKMIYAEDSICKKELFDYYQAISSYILPYIRNRALTLVRCPSDYKDCFYQKHLNQQNPGGLYTIEVESKRTENIENCIYLKEEKGLLALAQMGVLEIHPWGSTVEHLEQPDVLVFDLDPDPEVSWKMLVDAAYEIREELEQLKLSAFIKTTGGKGLHLVIPIQIKYDWESVKEFTHVFVEYLEKKYPKKYTSNMAKAKRKGKIFVDYLRNQRQATAIAPYSPRARLHAPVATPVHWDELTDNQNGSFYTIRTIFKRLEQLKDDPWKEFWTIKQSLPLDKI